MENINWNRSCSQTQKKWHRMSQCCYPLFITMRGSILACKIMIEMDNDSVTITRSSLRSLNNPNLLFVTIMHITCQYQIFPRGSFILHLTQQPCHDFNISNRWFYHLQLALVMNQYILVKVDHPQHQPLQLHFLFPRLTSQIAFLE